jgi:probable rRNA maturation factor
MPIHVSNRQRRVGFDVGSVQRLADRALPCAQMEQGEGLTLLGTLPEIEVTIISDRRMAELHKRFLAVDGPTDVITFQHGEIIVSAETARTNAKKFGDTVVGEIFRYIVHGLLHLNGFTDDTARASKQMHRVQEKILRRVRANE